MFDKRRALLDQFLVSRRREAAEAARQLEVLAEFAVLDSMEARADALFGCKNSPVAA